MVVKRCVHQREQLSAVVIVLCCRPTPVWTASRGCSSWVWFWYCYLRFFFLCQLNTLKKMKKIPNQKSTLENLWRFSGVNGWTIIVGIEVLSLKVCGRLSCKAIKLKVGSLSGLRWHVIQSFPDGIKILCISKVHGIAVIQGRAIWFAARRNK